MYGCFIFNKNNIMHLSKTLLLVNQSYSWTIFILIFIQNGARGFFVFSNLQLNIFNDIFSWQSLSVPGRWSHKWLCRSASATGMRGTVTCVPVGHPSHLRSNNDRWSNVSLYSLFSITWRIVHHVISYTYVYMIHYYLYDDEILLKFSRAIVFHSPTIIHPSKYAARTGKFNLYE